MNSRLCVLGEGGIWGFDAFFFVCFGCFSGGFGIRGGGGGKPQKIAGINTAFRASFRFCRLMV